jgi:molecular chaperone GrpE
MDENERFIDHSPDTGESDEVEIIEVVGVDDAPPGQSAAAFEPIGDDGELRNDEYLLDFDEPPSSLNGDGVVVSEPSSCATGTLDVNGDGDGETDHQRLMRLRADYDNLRKRIDRERSEFEFYANFALVGRLLPVMDNLERALAADIGPEGPIREGLVMIRQQLSDQLEQDGLRGIETVGQTFDPAMHDAVATEPSDEHPANTVLEELQKGYLFQDRVLRPAMVKVSTGKGGASGTSLPESNCLEQG